MLQRERKERGASPEERRTKRSKTYNTRDSLVVTHPTTSLAVAGLSRGERTGSRVFQCLWSYVLDCELKSAYQAWLRMLQPGHHRGHDPERNKPNHSGSTPNPGISTPLSAVSLRRGGSRDNNALFHNAQSRPEGLIAWYCSLLC